MTREETIKLIHIMIASYPNYKPTNLSETVDIWTMMLSDYDYNQIALGLKAYILQDKTGFAPSIGQIVDKLQAVATKEASPMEEWAKVSKALRNGLYHAEEEYAKLSPHVQKAVGDPSNLRQWAQTDAGTIENVIQSNFLRNYKVVCDRAKEDAKLPQNLKQLIQSTAIMLEG